MAKSKGKNDYGVTVNENDDGTVSLDVNVLMFMEACLANEKRTLEVMKSMKGMFDEMGADEAFWQKKEQNIIEMERELAGYKGKNS